MVKVNLRVITSMLVISIICSLELIFVVEVKVYYVYSRDVHYK